MKKIILVIGTAVCLVSGALVSFNQSHLLTLCSENVDALASCEVKNRKGEVLYACTGNEGECGPASAGGITLSCSGTEVTK